MVGSLGQEPERRRSVTEAPVMSAPAHLAERITRRDPVEAVRLLESQPVEVVAEALEQVIPSVRWGVLKATLDARRAEVLGVAHSDLRDQWRRNLEYPENTIGSLMDPPQIGRASCRERG